MLNALAGRGVIGLPLLVGETMYLGFIPIGTLFHYHHEGALSTRNLLAGVLALLALFFLGYALGPNAADLRSPHTASHAIAVVVFAIGYRLRHRFHRSRPLDALAAISYPLYLVHAGFGFTAISFLMLAWHVPYGLAATATALLSFGIAALLHRLVEEPTIRLGHRLRRRTRIPADSIN